MEWVRDASRRAGARQSARPRGLAIAALVGIATATACGRDAARPGSPVAADPVAGLPYAAAAESADALRARREWSRALPFVRHLEALQPAQPARFHAVFATTLGNSALEVRRAIGGEIPVTRSSVERIALTREALDRYQRSLDLAGDRGERSLLRTQRAFLLTRWGFPRDAFDDYVIAAGEAPLPAATQSNAAALQMLLVNPLRADLPASGGDADPGGSP